MLGDLVFPIAENIALLRSYDHKIRYRVYKH